MKTEKLFTTKQVSEKLEVSTETICRWVRSGKLKARKYTSINWRITDKSIKEFIKKADK